WLETNGVSILGWQCDELPAFYSPKSGLLVDERIETPEEAARIAQSRDELNLPNAILVAVPVPAEFEVEATQLEKILSEALSFAAEKNVRGKEITPFLLAQMSEKSAGKTLSANIALLENNAKIAAQIAVSLSGTHRTAKF
ncbi:MAG TPA: pseudouridine-5'-phosphate glycosidase, partial [Pyrinomonadaceae bacterium]